MSETIMNFSNHIRSLEKIKKSIPLALQKKFVKGFNLLTEQDRNLQCSKISIYKNKIEDFEKSVECLLLKIKDLDETKEG